MYRSFTSMVLLYHFHGQAVAMTYYAFRGGIFPDIYSKNRQDNQDYKTAFYEKK